MLLDTLSANLIGNLLTGNSTIRTGKNTVRASKGTIRAGQDF